MPSGFLRLAWILVTALPIPGAHAASSSWPGFRGPNRDGSALDADFPTHFGPHTNLVWKVSVPTGHSSPVIVGDRLFLTGYENKSLTVLAVDRATAGIVWRHNIEPRAIESGSRFSHPATATPAADEERLVSYFAPFGLIAHDFAGNELWRHPLPTPATQHGASSSPVITDTLVIQLCDQDADSYLAAFDKRDGSEVWRAKRPEFRRGFSTPLPWPARHPEMIIVAGTLRLVAYNLADGSERWSVDGLPNEMVASPTGGDGLVFLAGWTSGSGVARMPTWEQLLAAGDTDKDGQLSRDEAPPGPLRHHFPYIDANRDGKVSMTEYESLATIFDRSQNVALAVRPDGGGNVTGTHVVWKQTRGLPYVPSPLHFEGRLYLVKNGGIASCLDARTGTFQYQEERLGAIGDYYASPVAGKGKILAISQPGTAVVYRAGAPLEVLARNPLGEEVLATPAIADNTLYIRTLSTLFAFREGGCTCDY